MITIIDILNVLDPNFFLLWKEGTFITMIIL